ncbi:hypothetical protein FACS189476_07280 [Spirochaetia bacterium]|nr:hypothetical protein FACS189476_07280 [Spirochaetia bacterium]
MQTASFWTFNDDYDAFGTGFTTFGKEHLITLGCIAAVCAIACIFYRRSSTPVRKVFLRIWTIVPLVIECVTHVTLIFTVHPYPVHELPFQICNLFMVVGAFHAFKPTKLTGELLYSLGLVSPLLSLLTPDWTRFPFFSYWVFQDFAYHCFLVATPLMLLFGKDLRPNFKNLGKVTIFIFGFFAIDAILNSILGTNFVFLSYPAKGTFLEVLDSWFRFLGKRGYLLGMLLVDLTVWTALYLPWILIDLWKKKKVTQ